MGWLKLKSSRIRWWCGAGEKTLAGRTDLPGGRLVCCKYTAIIMRQW